MSGTDAHVPLHVRIARGDIAHTEVHDHRDGACDLPDPLLPDALWRGAGHCRWAWLWDGHGVCSCWRCHGGEDSHRERRRERRRVRRELQDETATWNSSRRGFEESEVADPYTRMR